MTKEECELALVTLRNKYKLKPEYSILIFITEDLSYYVGVFMKVVVHNKREDSIAECAKHQYRVKDIVKLEEVLQPYLIGV